jgi:hypothetical protein
MDLFRDFAQELKGRNHAWEGKERKRLQKK